MNKHIQIMSSKRRYWLFYLFILFLGESGYAQQLLKGPYLIEPGEKEMVIRWETNSTSQGYVRYGSNNTLNNKVKSVLRGIKNGGHLYEALLNDLLSDSTYVYKVFFGDEASTACYNLGGHRSAWGREVWPVLFRKYKVDILTMFTRAISLSLNTLPLEEYPTHPMVELKSSVNYDIPFTIQLAESSASYYKMDTYSGVLQGNEKKQIPLSIYSKSNITISGWGDISPDLRLHMIYQNQSREWRVDGGALEYWPGEGELSGENLCLNQEDYELLHGYFNWREK